MKDVENRLWVGKSEIDRLEVPEELEMRLRRALENSNRPWSNKSKWKIKLAAAFIVVALIGYNFDALAYYGKKIIGYDQVMNGTLSQLNKLGQGQVIGKSYTFKNGVSVTLSGIMLDENQLLTFYTIRDRRGRVDRVNLAPSMYLQGMFSRYWMTSGHGQMNDQRTELRYMTSFETPHFYERTLSLNFGITENGASETGEIRFKLDRSKAMGYTLKKNLNKTVQVGGDKITFASVLASPTKTVVEGSIQNIIELAVDQIVGERIRPLQLELKLMANGKVLPQQGAGLSTDSHGITFHQDFDALPPDLKKLQIELVSFGADHDANRQVELRKDSGGQSLDILGQNIEINKIYESGGDTCVTITTREGVLLSRVYLMMDARQVSLQETISDNYEKHVGGAITHTRTLHFPGTGRELRLNIQRIKYSEPIGRVIDIPLD